MYFNSYSSPASQLCMTELKVGEVRKTLLPCPQFSLTSLLVLPCFFLRGVKSQQIGHALQEEWKRYEYFPNRPTLPILSRRLDGGWSTGNRFESTVFLF